MLHLQRHYKVHLAHRLIMKIASMVVILSAVVAVVWYAKVTYVDVASPPTVNVTSKPPPPPPAYSQWNCVGSTRLNNDRPPWMYRSCHLKNVCYDGNEQSQLLFFRHPEDDLPSADWLSVNHMVPYQNDHRSVPKEQRVLLVGGAGHRIPENASWPHHRGNRTVTVLMNWFIPAVWSHLLMDNILPIFRLMELFSLDTDQSIVEPLYMENPCPPVGSPECSITDSHYKPNLTALLSYGRWPLMRIRDKYPPSAAGTLTCFEDVLVGPSLFTDHGFGSSSHGRTPQQPDWLNWGMGGMVRRFRRFILRRAGVNETTERSRSPLYDVVFLSKGKQAWINNQLDLQPLIGEFNRSVERRHEQLTVLSEVKMESMSLQEQLWLATRTKVIVAQEGSTSFAALYSPPGATLILLGSEYLDYYFWDNVVDIHIRYFRVHETQSIISAIWAGVRRWDE